MTIVSEEQARLRRELRLDYDFYKQNTDWNDLVIEDNLNKTNQIEATVEEVNNVSEQVEINKTTNEAQQLAIDANSAAIVTNTLGISQNASDISANTSLINGHINDISGAHDASAIGYDNTTSGLTATNAQAAIDEVDGDLDAHIADSSAHGVTGDNVGTEDYAQTLIGGVVLLADLVSDAVASAVSVTSPDATAAPATYDQTQAQTVVTLANEMKGDINQLVTDLNAVVTQLNDLLQQMKDAKQMSTT